MKNMIIEGKFERMSSGKTFDNGVNIVEFIEVGGKRLTKVIWSDYLDNFMQEAIGKNVRISVGKTGPAHVVGALEYEGKIEKEPSSRNAGYSQLSLLAILIVGFLFLMYPGMIYRNAVLMWSYPVVVGCGAFFGRRLRHRKIADALDPQNVSAQSA